MMDKAIAYILEVAACGGITKAARRLYITPSALSKYIIAKEEELGVSLFFRDGKKFTLTYAGERYVELLKKLQEQADGIQREMERIASIYMGKMRIGVQMALVETMVTQILPVMRRTLSNVEFSLEERGATELLRDLKQNELDLALTLSDLRDDELSYENVLEDEIVLVTARDLDLSGQGMQKDGFPHLWLPDEAYRDLPMVQYAKGQFLRAAADRNHVHYKILPESNVTVRTTRTALLCVSVGLGYTLTSRLLLQQLGFGDRLNIYSYGETVEKLSLNVVYNTNTMLLSEIHEFAKIVKQVMLQA